MTNSADPVGKWPIRRRVSAFMIAFGMTAFLLRGAFEFAWPAVGSSVPVPSRHLIYAVTAHGKRIYILAGERLLHDGIMAFWFITLLGILLTPKWRDPQRPRRKSVYDPDRLRPRWLGIGMACAAAVTILAYPVGSLMEALGLSV